MNGSDDVIDVCDFENISKVSLLDQLMAFPEHAEYACNLKTAERSDFKKICIFAVGESTVAGEIISSYADYNSNIQIPTVSDGRIPGWVDSKTIAVLVSYSGDNEVLSVVYDEVTERGATVYCITSGGFLEYVCNRDGNTVYKLPQGMTARSATGYEFGLLASLVQGLGICNVKDDLLESIPTLKDYRRRIVTHPFKIDLSEQISNSIVAVYSTSELRAAFKRWRMSFNQDMGCPSFCGDLPEFDHNELVGWANHNQLATDLKMVVLKCENESEVLDKIITSMIAVLEEYEREVVVVKIKGDNAIEKNVDAILLGDYLAQVYTNGQSQTNEDKEWSS